VVTAALLIVLMPAFEVDAWAAAPSTVERDLGPFVLQAPADASGRMLSQTVDAPIAFTMAGFEVPVGAEVEVRARDADGQWSPWFEAEPLEGDDGPDTAQASPDAGELVHTEPLWFGEAQSLQLRTRGADPSDVQATVIDSDGVSRSLGQRVRDALRPRTPAAEASNVPAEIIPRSGWGADESWMTWPPRATSTLELAVVHHTAGGNTYTPEQGPAVVRGIYHYHARTLGWGDIGYNLVVDRYGKVYEGRAGGLDRAIIGGHARGFNARSFGISVMGNFEYQAPPPVAEQAVARMVAWKLSLHGVDPSATVAYTTAGNERFAAGTVVRVPTVAAHRETGWTACPGAAFYARMGVLRTSVVAQTPRTPVSDFVPIGPERVLDTRAGGTGDITGKLGQRQTATTRIAGRGGVPTDALAVAINITAVDPSRASFLTVFPSGQSRPVVSSINVAPRTTVNNFVVAELGANGRVDVYNHNGQVDVVFDVVGYVPRGADYRPLRPARVLDTRDSTGDVSTRVGPRQTVTTRVAGRGGVPADAAVVALNITAVTPSRSSFLTLYPSQLPRPVVSNLNVGRGEVVNNFVLAQVGTDGRVAIYNHDGQVDVVLDVVGYLPAGAGYTPLPPARVLDTRNRTDGDHAQPLQRRQTVSQVVAGRRGVPADATAVAVNVTAVNPTHASYLTGFPTGTPRPTVSALNFGPGGVVGNFVLAELGSNGAIDLYNHEGSTDVVIDIVGYYR
jgi:hypothetical protein